MRVALVVYDGFCHVSGGYLYDSRLVDGLRARGHEVEVVGISWRSYPRALADGLDPRLGRLLTAGDPDVVLQDELCHPSLVAHNRLRPVEAPRVAVVHHLRCSEPRPPVRRRVYRAVERRYLRSVDACLYNGETTRRSVEGLVGTLRGRVAPPAGDRFDPHIGPAAIRRRARASGLPVDGGAGSTTGDSGGPAVLDHSVDSGGDRSPLRVVSVGTVTPRKGVDTLVRGLAGVEADWTLTVVGGRPDPAYADRLGRIARRRGVDDRVSLAGRVPDDRLASILRSSHLLAVPSRYEGLGIVYVEGMSFGLPALATTAGGAREVIEDGTTGFLVPPEDPSSIAAAVEGVARDRARLAEMGVAARRAYEDRPDWSATVDRVESFLRSLVDS